MESRSLDACCITSFQQMHQQHPTVSLILSTNGGGVYRVRRNSLEK